MPLILEPYLEQLPHWPTSGRSILAQYNADTIVVYQAYCPKIGHFAAEHGYFGGESFSLDRMSWIKTNFLWMMYRSGWGTKPDQEVTLAIHLHRAAFDTLLAEAIPSSFVATLYPDTKAWKKAIAHSDVRLQWDPDHDPSGNKEERRAIQIGLRGNALTRYAREYIIAIEDISAFVAEQRLHAHFPCTELITPQERIYLDSG